MKTKIVITNVLDFVLGIVGLLIACTELCCFYMTEDPDKGTIFVFAFICGLRFIKDSITKINIKEENNNGK